MSFKVNTSSDERPRVASLFLEEDENYHEDQASKESSNILKKSATALSTSKFANQALKKIKTNHGNVATGEKNPMDKLLAKLSAQSATMHKQREALECPENIAYARTVDYVTASTSSVPITPATDTSESLGPCSSPPNLIGEDNAVKPVSNEVLRLKLELERAKGKIAMMDQELIQTRITNHMVEQAIGVGPQTGFPLDKNNETVVRTSSYRPHLNRDNTWPVQDDNHSDTSDALSAGGFNRARALWGHGRHFDIGHQTDAAIDQNISASGYSNIPWMSRDSTPQFIAGTASCVTPLQPIGDNRAPMYQNNGLSRGSDNRPNERANRSLTRNFADYSQLHGGSSLGGARGMSPFGSVAGLNGGVAASMRNVAGNMGSMVYQPQPIGTPLSPYAPEFTLTGGATWKTDLGEASLDNLRRFDPDAKPLQLGEGSTYLPTTEPLNYRRLLDRTMNCNWKYIVDKIVCNNDQQASIFLQQKLKVGTTEQKFEIVEAIVAQAYPLMVNRFGNFLVQRCFEHGTPDQVVKIAEAIRGNTLNLSMDAFGCHVVQKAFDSVPEDYKAIMVHELLRRIPETVIHRYACHVWQKLFELRWTESPPQIMKYVNEALHCMWHEVALGETGSLVVQNIFENCLEEDKRPCIEEVLASIDIVAHGQFGNWCIQHICEHGAPADRSRAIDHVIRYASEYSMDQFASKVVEKCLKIGGAEFLGRYLDRVCEGRLDRPRIPLIDIASDQYGNYLVQYILTHSNPQHREIVACHIRKHMVSLRGSKFGSRVGMLCTNPAISTRPGPGVGPAIGTRVPPQNGPRYGGGAYR